MARVEDCVNSLVAQGLSDEEARAVVQDIQRERDRLRASGQVDSPEARIAAKLRDSAERARRAAQAKQRQAALNIVTRDRLNSFIESVKGEGGSVVDALEAQLVGSSKRFTGARDSASRRLSSLKELWSGSMMNELDKAGLCDLVKKDKKFSDDVLSEMIEPGVTGEKNARTAADIFSRYLEDWRQKLNAYGADIGKLDNYAPQSHNSIKMRKAGESGWVQFISERLDWDRTFPDTPAENIPAALSEVYQTLITGMKNPKAKPHEVSAFHAPRNMATSLGHERVLHFKDAKSAVEYNKRFGNGGVMQAVYGRMEVSARRLALMENFGPNPENMITNILAAEADKVRAAHGENPEAIAEAWKPGREGKLARQYMVLSGEAGTPENLTAARIAGVARAITSMAKLGGAVLSSFSDIVVKAFAARHAGVGWLEGWKKGFEMRFERFQSEEKKQLGRQLGIYINALLGEVYSRFDVNDAISGTTSRCMNTFFRWSGLEGWTEAHRAAYTFHLSSRLAQNAGLDAAALNPDFRAVLEKNGLMDRFGLLRHMTREVGGERYVIPMKAQELTDAQLQPYLPERLKTKPEKMKPEDYKALLDQEYDRMRDKLAQDVMGYFADETSYAVLEPDAKTRAAMYRGTKAGSVEGELLRFIWQFKSFPVTYWQRYVNEARWQKASAQPVGGFNGMFDARRVTGDIPGIAQFFLASAVMGYASMVAKDFFKGRSPRDPRNWETFIAAVLQGGGLGLLGDFFFGETDRFGNQAAGAILGPVLTSASKVLPVFGQSTRGEFGQAGEGALRLLMDNTPFVNLFYTRMAYDYMIQFRLREMLSPGTLAKAERRMKKENNQTYLNIGGLDFTPSHHIKRGGGFK